MVSTEAKEPQTCISEPDAPNNTIDTIDTIDAPISLDDLQFLEEFMTPNVVNEIFGTTATTSINQCTQQPSLINNISSNLLNPQ